MNEGETTGGLLAKPAGEAPVTTVAFSKLEGDSQVDKRKYVADRNAARRVDGEV